MEFSAALFGVLKKLVATAVSKRVVTEGEKFLTKRKIEARVDDAIAKIVENLTPFFYAEGISDHKRDLLLRVCESELKEIVESPKELFASSLDGQKIFDRRYAAGKLPDELREEGLQDLYATVFPQVANLVCTFPPAIEQWKIEGFRDGFRRLDDIAATLGGIATKLDAVAGQAARDADSVRHRVRQVLIQRIEFQVDLTGLRGDRPDAVPLEKCFVIPEIFRFRGKKSNDLIQAQNVQDVSKHLFQPRSRAVILGKPGSGKSTYSIWLQRERLSESDQPVVALARLRDIATGETLPSYVDILKASVGPHLRDDIDSKLAREWAKAGLLLIILDGFDETPPSRRTDLLNWMKELHYAVDAGGLIVTSRPLTTDHLQRLPRDWHRWELQSFDKSRITEYIVKWYANAPLLAGKSREVDAAQLATVWVNDPTLAPLAGTPLMLLTILTVHHMDGELPSGRARLYERYIDGMLGLWDSRRQIAAPLELSLELKKRILTRLALTLHLSELDQVGDEEMISRLSIILPQLGCKEPVEGVLDYLRERTGLLVGPGSWGFIHKNVGEFLVAAALRDGDQLDDRGEKWDRLRLFRERHNDRWMAILFFWAGLTTPGDLQSFIDQVIAGGVESDPELALALVHEQMRSARLPESWRRPRLVKIFQHEFVNAENMSYTCRYDFPDAYDPCDCLETLPGFSGVDGSTAIEECLRESELQWKDVCQSHDSLTLSLWMGTVIEPKSVDDLAAAMAALPSLDLPESAGRTALSWGLLGKPKNITRRQYIDVLAKTNPELHKIALFFLFARLAEEGGHEPVKFDSSLNEAGVLELVELILTYEGQYLHEEWLKQSVEIFFSFRSDRLDILSGAHSFLKRNHSVNESCNRAMQFIDRLVAKRTGLLAHSGASTVGEIAVPN